MIMGRRGPLEDLQAILSGFSVTHPEGGFRSRTRMREWMGKNRYKACEVGRAPLFTIPLQA